MVRHPMHEGLFRHHFGEKRHGSLGIVLVEKIRHAPRVIFLALRRQAPPQAPSCFSLGAKPETKSADESRSGSSSSPCRVRGTAQVLSERP